MERYQRVEKPRTEASIDEKEIRVTTQGRMRNYITYAITLFQEKGSDEISLKAMGRAINKTVMIAELFKRRVAGLHQITSIGSIDITDMWEPLEEGLLPLETTRHVSVITITLSQKELDSSSVGYQPPIPADLVKPLVEYEYVGDDSPNIRGRGRGRGRGRDKLIICFALKNSVICHGIIIMEILSTKEMVVGKVEEEEVVVVMANSTATMTMEDVGVVVVVEEVAAEGVVVAAKG
ncbi:uncharacterized protein LOC143544215 [Bidens hawaiensis]|uniref:uncharacterized protein LOC143544215 n=1 Tax=Bidens hawaiensis TaxID=980011 RepID=UPI0040499DEE